MMDEDRGSSLKLLFQLRTDVVFEGHGVCRLDFEGGAVFTVRGVGF